jgi:hypothetical protein
MVEVTEAEALEWAAKLQAKLNDWYAKASPNLTAPTVEINYGPRWIRVVLMQYGDQRSAYGFIDRTDGKLYKSASWKMPAKHARGSIRNADPLTNCGPYGMAYLR